MQSQLAQLEYELEQEFGESEWETEFEGPVPYTWPPGRTFHPGLATIAAGPYKTSSKLPCEMLKLDAASVRDSFNGLNRSIALLEKMKNVRPRDQQTWDEIGGRARKQIETIRVAMKAITERLKDGSYTRDGCTKGTKGTFAQVTEMVRRLEPLGGWRRFSSLRRVRDLLVDQLQRSR